MVGCGLYAEHKFGACSTTL
nr:hypothetical protein [Nostoc sp. DedQUE03]MDZ7976070.1 hypothetical protein [Nostoc sp. DedQUE03]MDZ8044046.1 hypothetical protein [Nostoc sp. DedQUE02]